LLAHRSATLRLCTPSRGALALLVLVSWLRSRAPTCVKRGSGLEGQTVWCGAAGSLFFIGATAMTMVQVERLMAGLIRGTTEAGI